MLGQIAEAKRERAKRIAEFDSGVAAVMSRLLHEAARNYMSVEEVAKAGGFTVKRVRQMMRDVGLNPRDGKNLLSKKAAEALSNNAALLGVEPGEMDLMSPLAYLPMGEQLRRELQDKTVSKVTELPEVSGNTVTVDLEDLVAVLNAADYVHDRSLIGPVDRMGDAVALVRLRAALP